MANTKEYTIKINGVTESIDAVKSLNEQLKSLEDRIKVLQDKAINIKTNVSSVGATTSSASKSASSSVISTENEIIKQQNEELRLQAKINAARDESFKALDATKAQYKEIIADQKQVAAQERINADAYSHTMQGMKQQLADLKAVINTTVIDETDGLEKISEYTKKANELNEKLLEMEKSYGQFGRQVGNYSSAFDGLDKVRISVGGTVREFGSAREALKTLNNELKTMAVNGQQDTEAFKELQQKVMELESAANDAKKPMDNLMDTMESVMAIANLGQGVRALFGIDDSEIQRSIQKLVALQNVMKGIETINKQIQTREGIGKWIAPLNAGVDTATKKLLTLNTALLGTSKAAKAAAVGIKAFSKAIKVALSAGLLIVVDLLIEGLMSLVDSYNKVDEAAEREKEVQTEVAKAYGDARGKLLYYKTAVDNFNGSKAEEKRLVEELNKEFGDTLGTYNSLAKWQDVLKKKGDAYIQTLINQAKAQAALNEVTAAYMNLETTKQDIASGKYKSWLSTRAQEREKEAYALQQANNRVASSEENLKKIITENDEYNKKHGLGNYADHIEKNGRKTVNAVKKVEAELAKARIAAMKEGLNKTILQLEEERKERLAKLDRNAKDYKRQEAEINAFYNDRILDESEKWSRKMNKVYSDLYSTISSYATNNLKMVATETKEELDRALKGADDEMAKYAHKMAGYGLFGNISSKSQASLGIMSSSAFKNDDFVSMAKQYIEWERKAIELQAEYEIQYADFQKVKEKLTEEDLKLLEKSLDGSKKYYEKLFDEAKALKERLNDLMNQSGYGYKDLNGGPSVPGDDLISTLYEEGYAKKISDIFDERVAVQRKYWKDVEKITKEGAEKEKKARLDVMYKEQQDEDAANLSWRDKTLQDTRNYYKELMEGYDEQLKNGLMSEEEYSTKTAETVKRKEEDIKSIYEEYNKRINNIEAKYETERLNIIKDNSDKVKKVNVDELNQRMTEMRDFQTQIHNMEQKQPVVNAWGFTNWKETKKNYDEIKSAYISLGRELAIVRDRAIGILGDKTASKELKDQAESILREARNMAAGIGEALDEVEQKISNWTVIQTFAQEIQTYLQEVMNSFNTIMQAVWQAEDVAFEKEQDELDKWNDELDKKLDEQQEIVEKHKDAIDSIEDELATARGSRRQHLIDQINAEMEAQREARRQEQKIQKEKEKAEKKQEELDKKRKKAEYERNMLQAIVNGAMAVTFAAMNNWPIPAIPMMALAAATTAAQVAIMAANKPYAKGGVLEGPSHKQGGIPVGNTGIEVEGKEYVIRKKSTTPNVELLDMINRSERKLTLDDFINFYSSGKLKKNISSMSPKTAFADGGVIPTISNDIDINDRLISAMEAYAERPVVVSVVDINNRQNAVKNVQVLAGLE